MVNPQKNADPLVANLQLFFDKNAARIVAALKQVAADDQSRNDQKNGQRRLTKEMVACFPLCMFSLHTKQLFDQTPIHLIHHLQKVGHWTMRSWHPESGNRNHLFGLSNYLKHEGCLKWGYPGHLKSSRI